MKLIVTGATGFVGKEVIRQALLNPAITSVIALARKPTPAPENAGPNENTSKLQSVVLEDWTGPYPETVKEHIKGADACIWTLAITPTKSRSMDFDHVTHVNHDYTVNGLSSMAAVASSPFRFIYTSGVAAERDQSRALGSENMGEYRLMRGRTENAVLEFAKQRAPDVQAAVTKPGIIDGSGRAPPSDATIKALHGLFGHTPRIHVSELAAGMIELCLHGSEKEPLWSDDLVEIAKRVLREEDYAK